MIRSCLDLASPIKGMNAFTCSLSADTPAQFWQEQHVIIVITSQLVTPLVDFLVMQVWEGAGDVSHARM